MAKKPLFPGLTGSTFWTIRTLVKHAWGGQIRIERKNFAPSLPFPKREDGRGRRGGGPKRKKRSLDKQLYKENIENIRHRAAAHRCNGDCRQSRHLVPKFERRSHPHFPGAG